jgi:nucleotidyltransferase substrate binding protein (TIGR01987 family)
MDNNMKDIRWKQRFQNFEKAYLFLEQSTSIEKLTDIERAGLIQFFEMTFELAWKVIKDFLQEEGFSVSSPKDAFKQAFQAELIKDGHVWIDALEDRNLTVHTYDEKTAIEVEKKIKEKYYPALKELYILFKGKIDK